MIIYIHFFFIFKNGLNYIFNVVKLKWMYVYGAYVIKYLNSTYLKKYIYIRYIYMGYSYGKDNSNGIRQCCIFLKIWMQW